MIGCQDKELSDVFRLLRAHGWSRNTKYTKVESNGLDPRYMFLNWGFNVRPTELQAGFGLEQLKRLPQFQAQRLENVTYFQNYLSRYPHLMSTMKVLPKAECSWFAMPIVLAKECPFSREAFVTHLEDRGVETRPIVAGNIARQPVCQQYPELQGEHLPGADAVHERGFYIGVHPFSERENLDRLTATFEEFIGQHR